MDSCPAVALAAVATARAASVVDACYRDLVGMPLRSTRRTPGCTSPKVDGLASQAHTKPTEKDATAWSLEAYRQAPHLAANQHDPTFCFWRCLCCARLFCSALRSTLACVSPSAPFRSSSWLWLLLLEVRAGSATCTGAPPTLETGPAPWLGAGPAVP